MPNYDPADFFGDDAFAMGQAIVEDDFETLRKLAAQEDAPLNKVHQKDMTLLHFALINEKDQALQVLVEAGASPHIEIEGFGSVMFAAIRARDPKFLKALLEAGVDPNATDGHQMPLFFNAATKDDLTALELLIEHGVDLNQVDQTGRPVALYAFTGLKYDQVEFLIKQGVDVTLADDLGRTLPQAIDQELRLQSVDTRTEAYQKLVQLKRMVA